MKERNNSWWSRRTRLERKLFVATSFLFLISLISIGFLTILDLKFNLVEAYLTNDNYIYIKNQFKPIANTPIRSELKNTDRESHEVCLTPACIEAASVMLNHIDESVNPCDDFYKFSCGGFLRNAIIPDNKVSVSNVGLISNIMGMQLRRIVEQNPKRDDPIYFKNIANMYKSCMNLYELERMGDNPLLDLLNRLGGWPTIEGVNWDKNQFDWVETTYKFVDIGLPIEHFYKISISPDIRNNARFIITLGEVDLGVGGRKIMLKGMKESFVRAYHKLLVESALVLGSHLDNAVNDIMDLLNFQIAVVNLTTPQEETRNLSKLYNKMQVRDLQRMAPNTPWLQFLTKLLNQTVFNTDEVLVYNPTYMIEIDHLLKVTDKRILSNHMMSSVVLNSIPLLDSKWRRIYDRYMFAISGRSAEPQRWEICIKSASSLFTALSALYVRKHFKEESKQKVNKMVTYIQQEFIRTLNDIDWMDSKTRRKALEKAFSISNHVGYPKQLLNNTEIDKVYENLEEFSEDNYLENSLKMSKWAINYSFSRFRKTRNKNDWLNYAAAADVNAYYSSIDNSIIFPAGILQGFFFDSHRPKYMNFGAIGTVIAHEITHAFDDIGRQFDKNGNHKNWWNFQTDIKFRNKAQCFIDQYNNYFVPENGLQMNGINTLGENIADNAGVKHSFRAYKNYIKDNKPEKILPGLKYNPEQLFWLTYGNVWCSILRPEMFKLMIAQGSHSPSRFRVIGSLSNLNEFNESFNCTIGSTMNPRQKCSVW